MNCPYCNGSVILTKAPDKRQALERVLGREDASIKTYEMATLLRQPDGTFLPPRPIDDGDYSRQEPARAPTFESDVKVPLCNALITGAFWSAGVTVLYLVGGWPKPLAIAGGVFFVASALSWRSVTNELRDLMWSHIEKRTGKDLNNDGVIGRPPARNGGKIAIKQPASAAVRNWQALPASERLNDIVDFALLICERERNYQGFGQKAFREMRHFLPSGFRVSDEIHTDLMSYLESGGLATRSGNNWMLSPTCGREHILRRVFEAWD
jgi:hypothetical protein